MAFTIPNEASAGFADQSDGVARQLRAVDFPLAAPTRA